MIPSLRDDLALPLQVVRVPSLAWAYVDVVGFGDDSRLDGLVDGIEAVRQAVVHIVNTERYMYSIYPSNYGIELKQFIGRDYSYFVAKIDRVMQDALMQDDRIVGVRNVSKSQPEAQAAFSEWEVQSVYGKVRYGFEADLGVMK